MMQPEQFEKCTTLSTSKHVVRNFDWILNACGFYRQRLWDLCKCNIFMIISVFQGLGFFTPNVFIQSLMVEKLTSQALNSVVNINSTNDSSVDTVNVETQAAQYLMISNLVRQLPSVLVSLQLGPWSDRHGRKFVIIMCIAGMTITNICYVLNSYYYDASPIYLILAGLPGALMGDYGTAMMALFGHVKDISNLDDLSSKIAILDGIELTTVQIGPLLGAALFVNFGIISVFVACVIFNCLGIICAYVTINEKQVTNWKTMVRDVCYSRGYLESFKSPLKKRENNKRSYILITFLIAAICVFSMSGTTEICYLYTTAKLKWDVTMNTYYTALIGGLSAVGTLLVMPLILHFYKIPDPIFSLVGSISLMFFLFGMAFSENTLSMFLVVLFNILSGMALVICRSIVTKCVPSTEAGKISSVYSVLQSISRASGQIVSTQIFVATVTSFIGTYFVVSGSLVIICIIFSGWMLIDMRRRKFSYDNENENVNKAGNLNEKLSSSLSTV